MSWTNQHDRGSEWEEETVEHFTCTNGTQLRIFAVWTFTQEHLTVLNQNLEVHRKHRVVRS